MLLLSGVLTGFAFPPIPFPITAFFGMVPFLIVLHRREKLVDINRAAYLYGFFTGIVSLYWVGAYTVAKDPFLMIAGGLMLFANPIFFVIPSTLYYAISQFKPIGKKNAIFFLPFFWATYEYFYMNIDVNFPWINLSNTLPYFQIFYKISDIIGALGITIVLVYINILLFKLWLKWRDEKKVDRMALRFLNVLILVPIFYGVISRDDEVNKETLKVGLIQPNLDPYEKWLGGNLSEIIDNYFALSDKAIKQGAKLVIWPETALPAYLMNGQYDSQLQKIYKYVDSNKINLLTGMPNLKVFQKGEAFPSDAKSSPGTDFKYASYNSVLLFTPGNRIVQQYGKVKLVPFGERTPYIDQIPILGDLVKWGVGISSWNVGQDTLIFRMKAKTSKSEREITFGALICFESVFPYYVAEFTKRGAEFFAVVTNDSWYGNTSGPYQHKEFSALRAIENHRSFVRAANGGISCLIDEGGNTISSTNMYETNVLVVDVPLNNRGTAFVSTTSALPYFCYGISLLALLTWLFEWGKRKVIRDKR
jgi:apolipoprotein N-acyltransferase